MQLLMSTVNSRIQFSWHANEELPPFSLIRDFAKQNTVETFPKLYLLSTDRIEIH